MTLDRPQHSERYFGKVMRTFTLAQDVDEAGATAKYSDGVRARDQAEEGDGRVRGAAT